MNYEYYISREKRDARAKALQDRGHVVKRSVWANQLLHPQYVEDYVGLEKEDTGLGNRVYKTKFPKLYAISY